MSGTPLLECSERGELTDEEFPTVRTCERLVSIPLTDPSEEFTPQYGPLLDVSITFVVRKSIRRGSCTAPSRKTRSVQARPFSLTTSGRP